MSVHVAILVSPYDKLILDGSKSIECRLTKQAREPFGAVAPGERIYFKRSAGPFFATAIVDRVWMTDNLAGFGGVDKLRERFNDRIHGTDEWWRRQRAARYATLVWLREVRPTSLRPRYKTQSMRAWYTLDDAADPLTGDGHVDGHGSGKRDAFDVELTRGNVNQRSVRVGDVIDRFPADTLGGRTKADAGQAIALKLRGGPTVLTDIVAHNRMIRWRGWGAWFERHGLQAGDRVRFVPQRERVYAVHPARSSRR